MAFGRERRETSAIIHTRCLERLEEIIRYSASDMPLPPPPCEDPELPSTAPESIEQVTAQAEGLFIADRAGFENRLEVAREGIIPHRLSLTADPEREGEKWLRRRVYEVAELILFDFAESWLASGLDQSAPDSTRWYLGIAMLNGLCREISVLSENRGYHLVESIAMSHPPGTWPSRAKPGRHQLDWKGDGIDTSMGTQFGGGLDAVHWLFDRMEEGSSERRVLLVRWIGTMLHRDELANQMSLPLRLEQMVDGQPDEVAAEVAKSLPRLLELDLEGGRVVLTLLRRRDDAFTSRALSDVLPAISRVSPKDALSVIDYLSSSESEDSRTAAVSALREISLIHPESFLERIVPLANDGSDRVRRMVVQACVRPYLELDNGDSRGLVVGLWNKRDEVTTSRLREMFLRMQQIHPAAFAGVASRILVNDDSELDEVWDVLNVRNQQRCESWKVHLSGDGELPDPMD